MATLTIVTTRTALTDLLKLRDERFVLPFNPLDGVPFRIPQPQPDPAPDVHGFATAAADAPVAATESEEDVQGYFLVYAAVALTYAFFQIPNYARNTSPGGGASVHGPRG